MNLGKTWNERGSITYFNIKSLYPNSLLYEIRSYLDNLDNIEMIFYYLNPDDMIPHHLIVNIDEDGNESVSEINSPWIGDMSFDITKVRMSLEESINIIHDPGWKCVSLRVPLGPITTSPKYIFGNSYDTPFVSVDSETGKVEILN